MLVVMGLAFVAGGVVSWRYGERYNRWFLRQFRWWPGAGWHTDRMDEDWYRIVFLRAPAVCVVGLGIVAVIAGAIKLVSA
jgi:hypothetical protein